MKLKMSYYIFLETSQLKFVSQTCSKMDQNEHQLEKQNNAIYLGRWLAIIVRPMSIVFAPSLTMYAFFGMTDSTDAKTA